MNTHVAVLLAVLLVAISGIPIGPVDGDVRDRLISDHNNSFSAGRTVISDNATFPLRSGPGQVVSGRTDLATGTKLTIRLQSTDPDHPFLRSSSATVAQTGHFRAVFDLSEVPPETSLRVVVSQNGSELTAVNTTVAECSDRCSAPFPATPSAVLTYAGDTFTLTTQPGQVLRGQTNLPPGTDITIRIISTDPSTPLIRQAEATVDDEGRFRTVIGFDDLTTTIDVRVAVVYNGSTLTTAQGTLTCVESCEGASTSESRNPYKGAEVGVVQVRNGSVARIRIALGDADTGVLTVRSPNTDYTLNLTLRDGTDDGEVTVLFNTSAIPFGNKGIASADPADEIQVNGERGSFIATEYRLVLRPPQNTSTTVATGLLVVTQDVETPLTITTPESASGLSITHIVALLLGTLLGVLGVGSLLGLINLRQLLPTR